MKNPKYSFKVCPVLHIFLSLRKHGIGNRPFGPHQDVRYSDTSQYGEAGQCLCASHPPHPAPTRYCQRMHHSWGRVPEEKSKESTGDRSTLFHQRSTLGASLCSGGGVVNKPSPTRVTPWTAARQAPLAIGFSRQEYWGGFPFPSPEDLPDPGIKPGSPALQAESLPIELRGKP